MRNIKRVLIPFSAVLFIGATTQTKYNFLLAKDYAVSIHGTSNLHAWDEKVNLVKGNAVVNMNKDGSYDLQSMSIRLSVHSIKSEMGPIMNNNTYKALKADEHPEIIFTLAAPLKAMKANAGEQTIPAKGSLAIAGVTRQVDMLVKIFMKEGGKLAFEGSQVIKMTDYAINPPTALMGSLKTGNEITIKFRIALEITSNELSANTQTF